MDKRFDKVGNSIRKAYARLKGRKMGKMPSYIPVLAEGDSKAFAIAFVDCSGRVFEVGSADSLVTIQSISKLLTLALAIEKRGTETVNAKVGLEGNPFPFNSLLSAVITPSRTISPFTNQGAMATVGLVAVKDKAKYRRLLVDNIAGFVGRRVTVDEEVADSDLHGNKRNRALAWILASYGKLNAPVEEVLSAYTAQCAVKVTAKDIAVAGATLANYGRNPVTGMDIVSPKTAADTLKYIDSVTMPNMGEEWDLDVGPVAAKSGVGGGLMVVLHGVGALGIIAPPLNKSGVTAKGYAAAVQITKSIIKAYAPDRYVGYSIPRRTRRKKRNKRSGRKSLRRPTR